MPFNRNSILLEHACAICGFSGGGHWRNWPRAAVYPKLICPGLNQASARPPSQLSSHFQGFSMFHWPPSLNRLRPRNPVCPRRLAWLCALQTWLKQ